MSINSCPDRPDAGMAQICLKRQNRPLNSIGGVHCYAPLTSTSLDVELTCPPKRNVTDIDRRQSEKAIDREYIPSPTSQFPLSLPAIPRWVLFSFCQSPYLFLLWFFFIFSKFRRSTRKSFYGLQLTLTQFMPCQN